MDLVSIGEFARLSRLSPKALRLYDQLGLLPPERVDPGSGYRWYAPGQLRQARLVAALRQIEMPLQEIKLILDLDPDAAAEQLAGYWAGVEADACCLLGTDWLSRRIPGLEEVCHVRRRHAQCPGT